MTAYNVIISVTPKEGCDLPEPAELGGDLFDVLHDVLHDAAYDFTVDALTISPVPVPELSS